MKIAVTNLKGGVGKTTIAVNLAASFTQRGKSVCIIDTDQKQHSSLEWASCRHQDRAIIQVFAMEQNQINSKVLSNLQDKFDIVIIDGTPQLSELATRTILVSDIVIIPISPSIFDFRAFESFLKLLKEMNGNRVAANLGSVAAFVVMNRVNERANIAREIGDALGSLETPIMATRLVNRTAYADNATDGIGVVEGKDRKAREEFGRFTDEIEQIISKLKEEKNNE
jgi:chromosome partitioning protein